jgi:transposase
MNPIGAGTLARRIKIQRPSTVKDSLGAPSRTWIDVATVWADIQPLSGREAVIASRISAELTHQITVRYRQWAKRRHIALRQTHRPGDKLFVDFAGRTVEVRDRTGGPSIYAQVFVAVLGYSNWTYLQAVASQTTADWVQCHVDCFAALGGAPNWVVPDNLKAAVWRRERDRVVLNPAYRECLSYYDTAALPTGVRKPKHKAKAEVGVQIAQRWVLFALRDRIFFSLQELNAALKELTAAMNAHPFKRMAGSRQERFDNIERATLKPLPPSHFELCDWRYGVRVGDDYHVEHERSFYSVPSELRGQRVDLRHTSMVLEVMHRGRRVAMHPLAETEGEIKTAAEHRPDRMAAWPRSWLVD